MLDVVSSENWEKTLRFVRHSLKLHWFADLMNVTKEVTIHRPNISTLLSSAFIRGWWWKALDRSVETLGLWIVTSSVTFIKSANQCSFKLCLIVHLVAVWTLIYIKVCVNVLLTSYWQVTDTLPTVSRLSADCRPTGSQYFGQNLSAVCQPTVGRLSADSRPTGFLGSSSSQLPHFPQFSFSTLLLFLLLAYL